jgi:hypothetical protein
LGFDHFTLYDVDGSAASYLSSLLNSTFLTYYHRWSPTPCLANVTAAHQGTYCAETLLENHCVWNSRGISEWAMLVHAPDCFLSDSPGLPGLFGLLNSMDHAKSTLLLPTVLFAMPPESSIPKGGNLSTAADVFTVFNTRVCALLNCYRHVPVFDPHMIYVSQVHDAHDFTLESRTFTASLYVNHYIHMFSSRSSESVMGYTHDGMLRYPNGSHDYCIDNRMAHVTGVVRSLLATHADGAEV